MYKLEFTLKQHTPIIHFQHDQDGATLRASEVKPKLDRFLRERLVKFMPNTYMEFRELIETLPNSVNKENKSSPYKLLVQLNSKDSVKKYVIASYIPKYQIADFQNKGYEIMDRTPYFADNSLIKESKLHESKLGIMLKKGETLRMGFRFMDKRWDDLLKIVVPLFLVNENFGTRQNKGFGCFLPINIKQSEMESLLRKQSLTCFKLENCSDLKTIFNEIDLIYKDLKSGSRNRESVLRKHFNNLRPVIEWEKPAIQEKVAEISNRNLKIQSKSKDRQFVRALLGLPEIFEYPKHGEIKAQVQPGNDNDIERYGSPVTFKIFENVVYLVIFENENAEMILNKKFKIEFSQQGKKYNPPIEITTPKYFDVTSFINAAMKNQRNWIKL